MIRWIGRSLHALAVWTCLASFGIYVGILALLRNLERTGAGGRWRRMDARAEDIDALLHRPEEPSLENSILTEETQTRP